MLSDDVRTQLNTPSLFSEEAVSIQSAEITSYDVLILDAYLRQALVSIRSLGKRGLRIAALNSNIVPPAFSSLWCQAGFVALQAKRAKNTYIILSNSLSLRVSRC